MLLRIEEDAAYAAAALDAELDRASQLDPRHRALATEIVYGVLRTMPVLDEAIAKVLSRGGIADVTPRIRVQLRIAAYQLFFLDRVPAFAAVNEAVDAVRVVAGEKGASFANAVLRKLSQRRRRSSRCHARRRRQRQARASPRRRLALGSRLAPARARRQRRRGARRQPPHRRRLRRARSAIIGLRVEYPEMRDEIRAQLAACRPDAEVTLGKVSPLALLLRNAGDPHRLPGYAEARFSLQEEGSQMCGTLARRATG